MVYDELDRLDELFFLVSGGRDSTAMVLLAHEQGIKGNLLFGDTRLNLSTAKEKIYELQNFTGWPLFTARYKGDKTPIAIVKDSFLQIPQCITHMKETGTFRRNMFSCCSLLKHKPMEKLQEELAFEHNDAISFVMGLKNEQPAHRLYRMKELREKNTRYRTMTKNNLRYYYPLRDMKERDIDEILQRHCFNKTISSGCSVCPIFCVFPNWKDKDPDTWRRSIQMADRLGIEHPNSGQQFLTEYQCKG